MSALAQSATFTMQLSCFVTLGLDWVLVRSSIFHVLGGYRFKETRFVLLGFTVRAENCVLFEGIVLRKPLSFYNVLLCVYISKYQGNTQYKP